MILVTGCGGMLGTHLNDVFSDNELFLTTRTPRNGLSFLNVCDREHVMDTIGTVRPKLVLHLAAETDVDRCEREVDHAYHSNVIGSLNVALACQRFGAELTYVSSCGVFDGRKPEPYNEFDEPNPLTIYHRSKLEGEKVVANLLS